MLDTGLSPAELEVPPELPTGPLKLAFIAEAPGADEVDKQKPFVGGVGGVFNAVLRSAGVFRSECLTFHFYPRQLESGMVTEEHAKLGKEGFIAFHTECTRRMWRILAEHKPTVVVPLCNSALKALTGQPLTIAGARGSALQGLCPEGIGLLPFKVCPTFSPGFVIANWKQYHVVIGDIIRALRQREQGRLVVYPTRRLNIAPTIEQVREYLGPKGPARNCPLLSCDIETGWGMIRGLSFAHCEEEGFYVPFLSLAPSCPSRSYWPTVGQEIEAWQLVKETLESPVPKLGQNFAGYDAMWLLKKMGIRVRNLRHDLRLLHAALYPELPKSLKFMAGAYSAQGAWKNWSKHSQLSQANRGDKRDE